MTKSYRLEGLCCANCAAKIERKLQKVSNLDEVVLNFMTKKLILTSKEEYFDDVLNESLLIIKKIEPDCKVREI